MNVFIGRMFLRLLKRQSYAMLFMYSECFLNKLWKLFGVCVLNGNKLERFDSQSEVCEFGFYIRGETNSSLWSQNGVFCSRSKTKHFPLWDTCGFKNTAASKKAMSTSASRRSGERKTVLKMYSKKLNLYLQKLSLANKK